MIFIAEIPDNRPGHEWPILPHPPAANDVADRGARWAMRDPVAIVQRMAGDFIRLEDEQASVLRPHMLDLGWTDAQLERWSQAAIIKARGLRGFA